MEPNRTERAKLADFMGSPVQNQEHVITQRNVANLIWRDFLEKICFTIFFIFELIIFLFYHLKINRLTS